MKDNFKYCPSLTKYQRRDARVVEIGNLKLGGEYPIRVQSMTTTDTMDTQETVAQSIRMIKAGCEYVRITAPSIKEAENLKNIKKLIRKGGFETPLIADIHFTPNAAEAAARIVEKVRINPGNYADRKKFKIMEYSNSEYEAELERLYNKFSPLVKICKEYGTAMRIGTNHGSLSDRIMNRYGDTPLGMVESAMEFIRICEDHNYYNLILSMKASNPVVMVQAYRLLVNKMEQENMYYPLHLGVTEAGEGIDGRIKSSVGIGTLLEDGLGDTIRVSLTEEPEYEIPVAQALVQRYTNRLNFDDIPQVRSNPINPFEYNSRKTNPVLNIGGDNVPRVIMDLNFENEVNPQILSELGYTYYIKNDKWGINDLACDYIDIGEKEINFDIPGTLGVIQEFSIWNKNKKLQHYPCLNIKQYLNESKLNSPLIFLYTKLSELSNDILYKIKNDSTIVLLLDTLNEHGLAEERRAFIKLINEEVNVPVIIGRGYEKLSASLLQLYSSTDLGGLLIDGLGDGIYISAKECGPLNEINKTSFGILQASRTRITKTEYISCPSCGRTLFDLQKTTAMIRSKTEHLKGIKIAVMGCIVNGPGEMADADYGYVGSGIGKISLYRGKNIVKNNIDSKYAVNELLKLIKDDGNWIDV